MFQACTTYARLQKLTVEVSERGRSYTMSGHMHKPREQSNVPGHKPEEEAATAPPDQGWS